jgi:hypothetical protein
MPHDSRKSNDERSFPFRAELTEMVSERYWKSLSAADYEQLNLLVVSDPAARRMYVDLMFETAVLAHHAGSWRLAARSTDEPAKPQAAERSSSLPLSILGRAFQGVLNSPIAATILVATLIYGVFGYLAWDLRSKSSSSGLAAVAFVDETTDVQWSSETRHAPEHSPIRASELLKIDSGLVSLKLVRGTNLLIEGPATWSIDDENSATLYSGKLVARVPTPAIGFTVDTPTLQIVDLGTEFGVVADADGQTQVEVFEGKVDVKYSAVAGLAEAKRDSIRVDAGTAKRFSKQDGAEIVTVADVKPGMKNPRAKSVRMTAFKTSVQNAVSQSYAEMVLADQPLGYWRLSDGPSEIAVDASGHGLNGRYCGALRTNQPGLFAGSDDYGVRVLGGDAPGWIEIDDVEVPASFTVEAWVRSSLPEWSAHSWILGSRDPYGFLMSPEYDGRSWRFCVGMKAEHPRAVGEHVPPKIDDQFHHYVGSYDATTDFGIMYFDGAQVAAAPYVLREMRAEKSPKLKLYLGRDDLGMGPKGCGDGWIDEVALYPHVLSAEAVERHFKAADVMGSAAQVVPGNK